MRTTQTRIGTLLPIVLLAACAAPEDEIEAELRDIGARTSALTEERELEAVKHWTELSDAGRPLPTLAKQIARAALPV